MSRIGGIVAPVGADAAERLARGLGERLAPRGASSVRAAGGAALVWTGEGAPALSETDGLLLALDGIVYNRRDLAASPDESDADLLARLVRAHGLADALARVNGDFAVAVFDPASRSLTLARDRFGLRPLYWAESDAGIAFASRPGPLLALPGVSKDVDRRFLAVYAASHYRYFDNEPEQSPYTDVRQVPASHAVRIDAGGATLSRWWELSGEPELDGDEAELAERYRELLSDAVSLRYARASRPAFTLSGGLDSSSVLACAVRLTGERQHAYSTVYEDATFDESNEIRPMLDACVAEWHQVRIGTPDVLGLIRRMLDAHDEPVATATWLSHFLLAEAAAEAGFGALFGGLGGDELNAGEYEYFPYHFADLRAAGDDAGYAREVEAWARHHDHPVHRKDAEVAEQHLRRLLDPSGGRRTRPDRARLERYADVLSPELLDLRSYEPVLQHPFESYLRNRAYQDLTRETTPCCLRAEDRDAAAFGLDHFLPFLDHRVVELLFRVPGRLKIRDGVTKRLLREAMRGVLPEETRTRVKKVGWNAPAHVWFTGEGRRALLDLLRSGPLRDAGVYDLDELARLADDHERLVLSGEPAENHMMLLWQAANLALWLESLERVETLA